MAASLNILWIARQLKRHPQIQLRRANNFSYPVVENQSVFQLRYIQDKKIMTQSTACFDFPKLLWLLDLPI